MTLLFKNPFYSFSVQDGEKLSESIMKTVLALSTVYYWLPKSQGDHVQGVCSALEFE